MNTFSKTAIALSFTFLILCNFSCAQQVIRGVVVDANSEAPLASANVIAVNTNRGTVTDLDGKFNLEVGNARQINVSFTGYQNQVLEIGSQSNFNIRLKPLNNPKDDRFTIRSFEISSSDIETFDTPVVLNFGSRSVTYNEALILKLLVNKKLYENFPPNIEPFLYIGQLEYQIFGQRNVGDESIELTFHIKDWNQIKEVSPTLLTVLHNVPINDPKSIFFGSEINFQKESIIDKR